MGRKAQVEQKTMYVLERLNWRWYDCGLARLAGSVRVQTYPDRESAESALQEKMEWVRSRVNPFTCGAGLPDQTSLDEGRLHDWVLDLGLTPPFSVDGKPADWAGWWRSASPAMTPLQRQKIWEALDRLTFYQVVERPAKQVVYVVCRINWAYNDQWFVAEAEGGEAQLAFRTRKEAEDYVEEAGMIVRDVWDDAATEEGGPEQRAFDPEDRLSGLEDVDTWQPKHLPDDLWTLDQAPFFEIVEVELEG